MKTIYKLEHPLKIGDEVFTHCVASGLIRSVSKGEIFISGAIPEGYIAPNDLSFAYHIGTPVKIRKMLQYQLYPGNNWKEGKFYG